MNRKKLIMIGTFGILLLVLSWRGIVWWNSQEQLEVNLEDKRIESEPQADYSMVIDAGTPGARVSPLLYGAFFEEINHAGDGGIYAELISNRSYEDSDRYPNGWTFIADGHAEGRMELYTDDLINEIQHHALKLEAINLGKDERVGIANDGYWGIRIEEGEEYRLSLFAKGGSDFAGSVQITLESANGREVYGKAELLEISEQWERYSFTLRAEQSSTQARLVLSVNEAGSVYFDVVSLFPRTWNDWENGLRIDLANKVATLKPRFLRFPGGCFVEGESPETAYQWKSTIGDIAERRTHWNICFRSMWAM